jgi:hypothetical protein
LTEPTIAETHLARTIALFHGSQMLYGSPLDGQWICVCDLREKMDGWGARFDRYAERHWQEYLGAARAILEARS